MKYYPHVKIRKVSQLLGKFPSSFIAAPQGKLYHRYLEINKTSALKINKGHFDKFMILSKKIKANIYIYIYIYIYTSGKAILSIPLLQFLDLIHL